MKRDVSCLSRASHPLVYGIGGDEFIEGFFGGGGALRDDYFSRDGSAVVRTW